MSWIDASLTVWLIGAGAAWFARRNSVAAAGLALVSTGAGAACLAVAAFGALMGGAAERESASAGLFGSLAVRLDPLAGVFLLPIALLGALGAVYAPAYARPGHDEERLGSDLAALQLLLAGMAFAVIAANTVLLLAAWEVMTISSWHLLSAEHDDPEVRAAGLHYLIAGHVSGGALALLFVFLAHGSGDWSVPVAALPAGVGAPATLLFLLALIGFGIKAAIPPLHVWLPDAHGAAPSHVSALMSGVLVTMGFYGLARFVPVLGPVPPAWGMTLLLLGGLGAALGVVMALSQSDVKRVLAYSTVENAGLIALAMGIALLATADGQPLVAALAWTAALLHVWNHAIAKGLLFFAGGAIARIVGDKDLERWGGLLQRQPVLATTMIVGAVSLVGLPGTHGFASEWLLFLSLLRGSQALTGVHRLGMLLGVLAAAFAAGMALACFVRVIGIGLLGHPRSDEAASADRKPAAGLTMPALVLAAACFGLVVAVRPMVALLGGAVADLVPGAPLADVDALAGPLPWLAAIPAGVALVTLVYRAWLARRRPVRTSIAWDCGYARPEPSMQYTASSLPQPVTSVLQSALRPSVRWTAPRGLWPAAMSFESKTPERALVEFYRPTFHRLAQVLGLLRRLQEGRVMVYLRYVGFALLLLLAWLFWPVEMPR